MSRILKERNQFIVDTSARFLANDQPAAHFTSIDEAVGAAIELADKLEELGVATWFYDQ